MKSQTGGKVHLIAIGGAAMHNIALALHQQGFMISGSDDEIFEPSRSRLANAGLLPRKMGWYPERIDSDIDSVILGMHAREDNPELLRARELGLRIYSFPEYLFERTRRKTRVVIAGSHGKTTITSMIMHVLNFHDKDFDYMVGAQLKGFQTMVRLSERGELAVFEGDEYLCSALDRRPKFHLYRPHVALISGIAWDHINVFPTYSEYEHQFRAFVHLIEPKGVLVFNQEDPVVREIAGSSESDIRSVAYRTHSHAIRDGNVFLRGKREFVPVQVFGRHNMQNIAGAKAVCLELGITEEEFFAAIPSFRGASRRLQLIEDTPDHRVYLDFAHAPSKVLATTAAVRELFPDRVLIACLELHTFSSLNADFLEEYRGSLEAADQAIVYFDPHTLEHKRLPALSKRQVQAAFDRKDLVVLTEKSSLEEMLQGIDWQGKNLLLMSSGDFSGINLGNLLGVSLAD